MNMFVMKEVAECWVCSMITSSMCAYELNVRLRPPRCVFTGPVVVRLAEMAKKRERERVLNVRFVRRPIFAPPGREATEAMGARKYTGVPQCRSPK